MSEATHVGSGKVRELYALDDERLLLVASRPHLDVRRRPPDRDPRQGARAHRPIGLLVRTHAHVVAEPSARAPRRRPLDRVQAPRDAADRVRRSRLPLRLGLEGLPRNRSGLRASPARRARRVAAAAAADLHAGDEGRDRARREHRPRRCGRARRRGPLRRGGGDRTRPLRARLGAGTRARHHPRRHEARVRDRRNGGLVLGDEAFTPDSSRFWPADEYRAGSTPPSFDKQFVRDYCESLGWDKTYPGPELPDNVVEGTRARYVEAFERLTGLSFDAYLADSSVVLA